MTRTTRSAVSCALHPDDVEFLRRAERARRRRAAAGLAGWWWRCAASLHPRLGRVTRRATTLLVLFVAIAGLAVCTAPPASADLIEPNLYCDRKTFSPVRADGGLGAVLKDTPASGIVNPSGRPNTKWAQYGTSGTEWDTFWLDCFDYRRIVNVAANVVFWLTKGFSATAISVFMWTFKGDLLNVFLDPNQNVGGSTATLDDMIRRVHVDVYLQLFSVAVIIGATVLAFRFLFKRAGGSDLLGKFALMVLVAGFALFYGGAPGGGGPNASGLLKTVNDWTNDVTSVVLSAFAGTDCETPSIRQGGGDDFAENDAARRQRRDMALQCAAESLYEVTIYTPWAVGELGSYNRSPRQPDGSPGPQSKDEQLAQRILAQQAYSWNDIAKNAEDPAHYHDERPSPDMDICASSVADHEDPSTFTGKLCDRARMRQNEIGAGDAQFKEASWSWSRVVAGNQVYWENWSGGQANNRFQVAVLALIGSSSIALIIILVSLAYLVLEIATIMFALMAPVAFLLGLIPGFGTKVLLKWTELLLGTFMKRIVLGLFVGLLMALYSVVLTINMPWLMKLILVCMVAAIGLIYRKRFSEAFAFNFAGAGAGAGAFDLDGAVSSSAGRAGARVVDGTVRGTGRTVRGTARAGRAVVGGTAGLAGSALGGAMGARLGGGSAWRGAGFGLVRGLAPRSTGAYQDAALREGFRRGGQEVRRLREEREDQGNPQRRNNSNPRRQPYVPPRRGR